MRTTTSAVCTRPIFLVRSSICPFVSFVMLSDKTRPGDEASSKLVRVLECDASNGMNPTMLIQFGSLTLQYSYFIQYYNMGIFLGLISNQ